MLKDLGSLSEEQWFAEIDRLGRREGYFARLGLDHSALFVDREDTLIVTFETVDAIRKRADGLPYGLSVGRDRDWSHLCLITRKPGWFRDPEVYRFFDQLVDDGVFDDYERIIFFGAGMGAYAAAAYSVAAPGSTVILVQPQATLDPAFAGWDPRFSDARRLCFTDRYGFAPDMVDGAGQLFVIYDPDQSYDAMHAALFRKSFTRYLPCRHLGSDLMGDLDSMHILPSVLTSAATGAFDPALFWTFYRARRNHLPYLRRLMNRCEAEGRTGLAAAIASGVGNRLNDDKFRARARDLAGRFRRARTAPPEVLIRDKG